MGIKSATSRIYSHTLCLYATTGLKRYIYKKKRLSKISYCFFTNCYNKWTKTLCQFYDIRKEQTFKSREKYKATFVPKDYVVFFFSNRNYYSLTFFLNRYTCTYIFLLRSNLQQSYIKTDMQKFPVMAFTRSEFT